MSIVPADIILMGGKYYYIADDCSVEGYITAIRLNKNFTVNKMSRYAKTNTYDFVKLSETYEIIKRGVPLGAVMNNQVKYF